MKNEKFYEAMENINDELLLGAIKEPKRKIHPIKKIKWTVLAAAIALLVAVPVVAETLHLETEYNAEEEKWEVKSCEFVSYSSLSEEVREDAKNWKDIFVLGKPFWRMQQVEEYLGFELPKNKFLPNPHNFHVYSEGKEYEGRYWVRPWSDPEGNVFDITIKGKTNGYLGRITEITTTYRISTAKDETTLAGRDFLKESCEHKNGELETFTNRNGIDYVIFVKRNKTGQGLNGVEGYIVINGINITIEARGYQPEELYERVKTIMENFE